MLPTTTGSHCVSRAAVFCCSPKLQVRFCMCIYIHFSDRFASKILVLIRRAANSCQPCPEGFTSKISHSFGQHLQPNGKKLQTKSRRCRLPITPTLQPCRVSPPSQDGMSASGPHGWRVTATAVPFQRSRPRRAGLDRERDEVRGRHPVHPTVSRAAFWCWGRKQTLSKGTERSGLSQSFFRMPELLFLSFGRGSSIREGDFGRHPASASYPHVSSPALHVLRLPGQTSEKSCWGRCSSPSLEDAHGQNPFLFQAGGVQHPDRAGFGVWGCLLPHR